MIKKKEHRPIKVETKVNMIYEDQKQERMLKAKSKATAVSAISKLGKKKNDDLVRKSKQLV